MPTREFSLHGQEKACLHLWDSKKSVAEKSSKVKEKSSAYICLPEMGITHQQGIKRAGDVAGWNMEGLRTEELFHLYLSCVLITTILCVDQALSYTATPGSICNSCCKHRINCCKIYYKKEGQAVWWKLKPGQEAISFMISAFYTKPLVWNYQHPKRVLLYFIFYSHPHSPVTLSLLQPYFFSSNNNEFYAITL